MITQCTRVMPARLLTAALTTALVALTLACGDDSGVGPAASTAPVTASLTATASVAASAPSEDTVDLAVHTPVSIIYGAGEGDIPSDQPALASGDFDGDGVAT